MRLETTQQWLFFIITRSGKSWWCHCQVFVFIIFVKCQLPSWKSEYDEKEIFNISSCLSHPVVVNKRREIPAYTCDAKAAKEKKVRWIKSWWSEEGVNVCHHVFKWNVNFSLFFFLRVFILGASSLQWWQFAKATASSFAFTIFKTYNHMMSMTVRGFCSIAITNWLNDDEFLSSKFFFIIHTMFERTIRQELKIVKLSL